MAITHSTLRADISRLLDEVLETGRLIEIQRGGRTLVITAKDDAPPLVRLAARPGTVTGDPGALIDIGCSDARRP